MSDINFLLHDREEKLSMALKNMDPEKRINYCPFFKALVFSLTECLLSTRLDDDDISMALRVAKERAAAKRIKDD